ncbi:hypothetical protein GGR54DRAFT_293101 [Hypoxylon sp. NC1633]|nr:hypothetical protein GGR54DRAFT_293101 [Hypoxylon sp. NC1633]
MALPQDKDFYQPPIYMKIMVAVFIYLTGKMSIFQRIYEDINTIIDPGSPPNTAQQALKKFTVFLLIIDAVVSFALITAWFALSQYSGHSVALKACSISYITGFSFFFSLIIFLYARIAYFKKNPARLPPTGYVHPDAHTGYDEGELRESTDSQRPKAPERVSSLEDVELGDLRARYDEPPRHGDAARYIEPSRHPDAAQYDSPYNVYPHYPPDETNPAYFKQDKSIISQLSGPLSEIGKGYLPNTSGRVSGVPSTDSFMERGNHQPIPDPQETRRYPQYSSDGASSQRSVKGSIEGTREDWAQLFSPSLPARAKRHNTFDEDRAGLKRRSPPGRTQW